MRMLQCVMNVVTVERKRWCCCTKTSSWVFIRLHAFECRAKSSCWYRDFLPFCGLLGHAFCHNRCCFVCQQQKCYLAARDGLQYFIFRAIGSCVKARDVFSVLNVLVSSRSWGFNVSVSSRSWRYNVSVSVSGFATLGLVNIHAMHQACSCIRKKIMDLTCKKLVVMWQTSPGGF